MVSVQTTWSAVVTITPEDIAVEVGTDSVNFHCTVQLEMIEAMSEHWIVWELYESKHWFTCRATRQRSTETKECVIGNNDLTSMTPAIDSDIQVTITPTNVIKIPETITTPDIYSMVTVTPTYGIKKEVTMTSTTGINKIVTSSEFQTELESTQTSLSKFIANDNNNSNKNSIIIAVLSVIVTISILTSMALTVYSV